MGEVAYAEFLGDRSELNIPFNGSDLIILVASKIRTLVIMGVKRIFLAIF